jgi:hypothetical protein
MSSKHKLTKAAKESPSPNMVVHHYVVVKLFTARHPICANLFGTWARFVNQATQHKPERRALEDCTLTVSSKPDAACMP